MRREGAPLPEKIRELQIYEGIIEFKLIALENNERVRHYSPAVLRKHLKMTWALATPVSNIYANFIEDAKAAY